MLDSENKVIPLRLTYNSITSPFELEGNALQ
jgi:hypothetical protein